MFSCWVSFTFLFSNGFVTLHFHSSLSFKKKQGVFGWWAILLSNFGITNWKAVTVFHSFVEHSKIQHLLIFLGYPVFLAYLFLCLMCNTQKITKYQTSTFRKYLHYVEGIYVTFFSFLFSAFFHPYEAIFSDH